MTDTSALTAATPPAVIGFRPSESLLDALTTRANRHGLSPADVARRDLGRYYALLRYSVPVFTENEAGLLVDALNGTLFEDDGDVLFLPDEVEDAIEHPGLAEKWGPLRAGLLADELRHLRPVELYALADAVERVWQAEGEGRSMKERVREVGLVRGD